MPAVADEKATPAIKIKPRRRLTIFVVLAAGAWSGAAGSGGKTGAIKPPWRRLRKTSNRIATGSPRGTSARLLEWNPGSDEGAYLLGACEKERNRTDAALQAWARVPPGSPFSPRAIQGRMDLLSRAWPARRRRATHHGGAGRSAIDRSAASLALGPVYDMEGRGGKRSD